MNPYKTLAFFCTDVLSLIIVLVSLVLFLQTRFFKNDCPVNPYNGVECNGQLCRADGICDCGNLFSGPSCGISALPGYIQSTNQTCSGRGDPPLVYRKSQIPKVCLEIKPSVDNDFVGNEYGYDHPECQELLRKNREDIYNEIATAQQKRETPRCYCHPPYLGHACEIYACPRTENGDVCNNLGNTTVAYLRNGTTSGLGCQCQTITSQLKLIQSLGRNELSSLYKQGRIQSYSNGLCANLYIDEQDPSIVMLDQTISTKYTCVCLPKAKGEGCTLNVCPTFGGKSCAGYGFEGAGFGYEANTTRNVSAFGDTCAPICTSGTTLCFNECKQDEARYCKRATSPLKCPPETPYRCPNGICVTGQDDGSTRGFIYGYLEQPPTNTLCETLALNSTGDLVANCIGDQGRILDYNRYLPSGELTLDSPLRAYKFQVYPRENGVLKLYNQDSLIETVMTTADTDVNVWITGTIPMTRDIYEENLYETWIQGCFLTTSDQRRFDVYPSPIRPLPFGEQVAQYQVRFKNDFLANEFFVATVQSVRVEFGKPPSTFSSWDIIANVSVNEVLRPDRSVVSMEDCFSNLVNCVWRSDTYLSLSGKRKLCPATDGSGVVSSTRLNCDTSTLPAFMPITYVMQVTSKSLVTTNLLYSWTLQNFTGTLYSKPTLRWENINNVEISHLQFVTMETMRRAAICPTDLFLYNSSIWDRQWAGELTRSAPTSDGEYALGVATTLYGDKVYKRGIFRGDNVIYVEHEDRLYTVTDLKVLNSLEYRQGVYTCEESVWETRCPDGQCAQLVPRNITNMSHTCSCSLTYPFKSVCTCTDENDVVGTCTCENDVCLCAGINDRQFEESLLAKVKSVGATGYCLYFPVEDGISPAVTLLTNQTTQLDLSESIVLWFMYSSCDVLYTNIPVDVTCTNFTTNGNVTTYSSIVRLRYRFGDEGVPSNFTITGSGQVTEIKTTGKKSIPLYTDSISVSTNSQDSSNVIWNSNTVWEADETDTTCFLQYSYATQKHFTWLLIEFAKLGVYVDEVYGSVPVQARIFVSNDTVQWEPVGRVTDAIINGTVVKEIELKPTWGKHIKIFSHAPMSIRIFLPFSDQLCFAADSIENLQFQIDDTNAIFSKRFIADTLAKGKPSEECICTDSCKLQGFPAGNNGVCQDSIFRLWDGVQIEELLPVQTWTPDDVIRTQFNVAVGVEIGAFVTLNGTYITWLSDDGLLELTLNSSDLTSYFSQYFPSNVTGLNLTDTVGDDKIELVALTDLVFYRNVWIPEKIALGTEYCYPGQDCTDCGHSERNSKQEKGGSCILSDETKFIFDVFSNTSLDVGHLFMISELIIPLSKVSFDVVVIQESAIVFTPGCLNKCPLYTCPSGVCADTKKRCPEVRYICPGDGCVTFNDESDERTCVCRAGHGGASCSYTKCTPADPEKGLIDPALWCTCMRKYGGRLVIRPPYSSLKRREPLTVDDLRVINRAGFPRMGPNDVRYINVHATDAPYEHAVVYQYESNQQKIFSNCPFVLKDRTGRYLTLEQCVERRSTEWPFLVLEWKTFYDFNGQPYQNIWPDEFAFNDLPYPCAQGSCVEDKKHCYQQERDRPECNGFGTCMVDGSCACEKGRTTFVLDDHTSKRAKYPYDVDHPHIIGTPDHREYVDLVCLARDCDVVDCTQTTACYQGSLLNGFKDRLFTCPENTKFPGMCAPDLLSCQMGSDITSPTDCASNGYSFRVENRPNERLCRCGTPPYQLAPGTEITDSTNVLPNGFGGPKCTEYYCSERTDRVYYERLRPDGQPYVDRNGDRLPGRWFGPCRSPAGFDIDDLVTIRASCCNNGKPLEHCTNVLCVINGVTQCVGIDECTGAERTPKIYTCHNHGPALSDSTCECTYDPITGTGYTDDEKEYSFGGCFGILKCPVSPSTGTTCGAYEANKGRHLWQVLPPVKYMLQQVPIFVAREGRPLTHRSIVSRIYKNIQDRNQAVTDAIVRRAQYGLGEVAIVESCVAVGPNDTINNYCCMVDNKIPPPVYGQGFNKPYLLRNFTLSDESKRFVFTSDRFVDTITMRYISSMINPPLVVNFVDGKKYVDVVRVRLTYNQTQPTSVKLKVTLSDSSSYVSLPILFTPTLYSWVDIVLREVWQDLDLTIFVEWDLKCQLNPTAELCTSWYNPKCIALGGELQVLGSFTQKYGCQGRCCKLVQQSPGLSDYISLQIDPDTFGTNIYVYIQHIDVFVHGTQRLSPVPENLRQEVIFRVGTDQCLFDEFFINHPDVKLCGENTYFVGRNFPEATTAQNLNYEQARAQCLKSGASLAVTLGGEENSDYARSIGAACFGNQQDSASVCDDLQITGTDHGCLIGAMEVTTPETPANDYLIQTPCQTNGCFAQSNDMTTDTGLTPLFTYSTPDDNGNMWKTPHPTLPQQAAWNLVISEWYAKTVRITAYTPNYWLMNQCDYATQNDYYFSVFPPDNLCISKDVDYSLSQTNGQGELTSACMHIFRYGTSVVPTNTAQAVSNLYTKVTVPGADRDGAATVQFTSPTQQTTYNNLKTGSQVPPSGTTYHWSREDVCQVTIFDRPACEMFTHGSYANPRCTAGYRSPNGQTPTYPGPSDSYVCINPPAENVQSVAAKRTFIIGPDNYERYLINDLGLYNFDECADGTQSCENYGKRIQGRGYSFTLNGPCQAWVTNNEPREFRFDTSYPSEAGQVLRGSKAHVMRPFDQSCTVGNRFTLCCPSAGWGLPKPQNYWYHNCYSNFHNPPTDSWIRCGHDGEPACTFPSSYDNEKIMGMIVYFRVVPKFTAFKIEVKVYVNAQAQGNGTSDEYALGYQTHQYMCLSVNTRRVFVVAPARYGAINEPMQSAGEPVVVANVNNLFYREGPDGNLISPFTACPREVKRCPDCLSPRPVSTFQFHPTLYQDSFAQSVNVMRQTQIGESPTVIPDIFVTWTSATGVLRRFHKLIDLNNRTFVNAYARLISRFKPKDYPTKYILPLCAAVFKNPTGSGVPYRFDTAICTDESYRVLCLREIIKYTAQSGTLLDKCGAGCRTKAIDPWKTPFDLHPDGLRANNPALFRLIDKFLDGSYIYIADTEEVDWYSIYQQILNRTDGQQNLVSFFPEARDAFIGKIYSSLRPGLVSRGAVADPSMWYDMELERWHPFACEGEVCSLDTLICLPRSAATRERCRYENQLLGGAFQGDLPTILQGIPSTNDLTKEVRCGVLIDPTVTVAYFNGGGPWRDSSRVRLISSDSNARTVLLEMLSENATWGNTGQKQDYIFMPFVPITVTGDVECLTCTVQVWLSPFVYGGGRPPYKLVIGSITGTGTYSFTVNHTHTTYILGILGWDILRSSVGQTVELSAALVSDQTTRQACQQAFPTDPWVEMDAAMDSAAPNHKCVVSRTMADLLGVKDIGVCSCSKRHAQGGPTCDQPATESINGKYVCNNWGDPVGNAIDLQGNIVPVGENGIIYESSISAYRCAKCKNLGMILQTTLHGEQPFDFRKVIKNFRPVFQSQYQIVDVQAAVYPQQIFTYSSQGLQVCAQYSYTKVSFQTLEDLLDLYSIMQSLLTTFSVDKYAIDTDLKYRSSDGSLIYEQRGEPLYDSSTTNATNIITLSGTTFCTTNRKICDQLHFNNLLYNSSESSSVVNGGNATLCLSTSTTYTYRFNLLRPVQFPITIEIWADSGLDITSFIVITYADASTSNCFSYSSVSGRLYTWTCTGSGSASTPVNIKLTTGVVSVCIRGVTAFNGYDNRRVPGLYD